MPRPETRAERTGYAETSRHADVMAFVTALAADEPRVHLTDFGASPEGRALPLVVISTRGVRTPDDARRVGLPIVLVICGIHAGEVEGKEAALMLVRDRLAADPDGLLDRITLVLVPLFNPDGNDRIDPANRAFDLGKLHGQLGPKSGVGTRTNASGINLNRDYLRQDAPEMRLLQARVCQAWGPDLTIDCHATNGSVHRFALTYDVPHTDGAGRPEPIALLRDQWLPEVTRRVRAASGRETFFYGNFVADEGGTGEGWTTYTHHPRFGSNYRGLTGRGDILFETYAYLEFEERVATTYELLTHTLVLAAERGAELQAVVAAAAQPRATIAVRSRLEATDVPARILTRAPRTLDGAPIEVTIPHLARFVGTEVVTRPWGYAVPPAIGAHLARHGLPVRTLDRAVTVAGEVAIVDGLAGEHSRDILEAAAEVEILAHHEAGPVALPAGTCVVATDHRFGAIATYLCEARSDDGLVACGWLPTPAAGDRWPAIRITEPM
ncbi:MAG: M14 family metallopeptidase [Deltaproteobacteria bacterium]|nr:M14 family metallopeptidase [Deltaproteobacteria bacterium]